MRTGVQEQPQASPRSRMKRRTVVLKAFVPPILGWKEAQWQTIGKYLDEATARARADALAEKSWPYRHATSWLIDGNPYTPGSVQVGEETLTPMR